MKIYTRGGDDGSTGLLGGARVSKAALRVEAYGSIDELNAILGWVRAGGPSGNVDATLASLQSACFRLGAWLASAPGKEPAVAPIEAEDVERLEAAVDAMESGLQPLRTFILPGGSEVGARLHVARTVCRRAERALVALAQTGEHEVAPMALCWINRLSDLLFVQARWVNHRAGSAEVPWLPNAD